MRLQTLISALLSLTAPTIAQSPVVVQWSTKKSYGPDGPWQVVTVELGINASGPVDTIDLLPGAIWESKVNTPLMCNGSPANGCPAATAGLYNANDSDRANRTEVGLVYQWGS